MLIDGTRQNRKMTHCDVEDLSIPLDGAHQAALNNDFSNEGSEESEYR